MNFFVAVSFLSSLVLVVSILERMPAFRVRPLPSPRPYLATDIAWYLVATGTSAISVFVFRPQLEQLAIGPMSQFVGGLPPAAQLVLAVVVFDLVSFGVHVGLHRSNTLWNVHKVHHSSLHLDGLATTRSHMFEQFARFIPAQAVLFVIGVPVAQVALAVAIVAAFGVFNHCNLAINPRWAEAVIVTPRLHHRHHLPSTSPHNFGTVFSFWDRALGTLVRLDTEPDTRFGVPGEVESYPQRFASAVRQPARQIRELRRRGPYAIDSSTRP